MAKKLIFRDRALKSFEFREELGPCEEKPVMSYMMSVSEPALAEKNNITVSVQAKLTADGQKSDKPSEAEPFLRLDLVLSFELGKTTKAEKANLKGFQEVFDLYASNICAEIITSLLMSTKYRTPNFPR